jgi:nucleoside 2-deoxyribosyltransferase
MMRVVKAPNPVFVTGKSVFLAGSIDMGKAVNWQEQVTAALENYDCTILNPRRDDWDSSWKQDITDPKFREQVEWELDCLEKADIVVYYFDPDGQAPITLLELGLHARSKKVCNRYRIPLVDELETLIAWTKAKIVVG